MTVDIQKLKLPSVSPEGLRVLDMLKSDDVEVPKLTKLIALDPVLSSTLIKYANSPMYRRAAEVSSVQMAIGLLGLKNVSAAVMVATMKAFAPTKTDAQDLIWRHGVSISTIAKMLADRCARALAPELELIGMLHDMGALVLASNFPQPYQALMEKARASGEPLDALEPAAFGVSRDEVMAVVAERFRLPEGVATVLRSCHGRAPLTAIGGDQDKKQAILALAHHVERRLDDTPVALDRYPESVEALCALLELSDDELEDVQEDCELVINERFMV